MAVAPRARANAISQAQLLPSLNVDIPPTHPAWRAYWTKDDDDAFVEIEITHAKATKATKESEVDSIEYWDAMRIINKMEIARGEIKWRLCQKVLNFDYRRPEYQCMRRNWLVRRAELEDKRTSIEQMALEAGYRNSLMSLVKVDQDALPVDGKELFGAVRCLLVENMDAKWLEILEGNLKKTYGVQMVGKTQLVWSPLEWDWRMEYELKATHILPFSVGEATVKYLTKACPGRLAIYTADNGLFLPHPVADALQNHYITLAPIPIQEEDVDVEMADTETGNTAPTNPIEYRVFVVDKAEVWNKLAFRDTPFSALHGRGLLFCPGNSNRPSHHYLYLHYLVSMIMFLRKTRVEAINELDTPEFQLVDELLRLWGSEKTQVGVSLGGLLRNAVQTVQETLMYPDAPDRPIPVNEKNTELSNVTTEEFQRMLDSIAMPRMKGQA